MRKLKTLFTVLFLAVLGLGNVWGAEVKYSATTMNNKAWTLSTIGTAPSGSSATCVQTYGTISQMTSGNTVTLTLKGFAGNKITGIKLSMKSNAKAGAGYLSAVAGSTTIASIGTSTSGVAFNNAKWNGSYTSSYSDVTVAMSNDSYVIGAEEDVVITIGATTNSLYCQSFTITYVKDGAPTLSSIAVSGAPTKTVYEAGEEFDPAGLTVTGTYSDNSTETITEGITWSEPAALTEGQTSVSVTATVGDITSTAYTVNGLTVNAHVATAGTYNIVPNNVFFNCDAFTTKPAGFTTATGSQDDITVLYTAASSAYINDAQCRMYSGTKLTFSVPEGFEITAISFTADGTNWAGTHTSNAGSMTDNKHWTGAAEKVTITFGGTCRCTKITVTYAAQVLHTLTIDPSIEHGSVSASATENIKTGTQITLTNTPATGYKLAAYSVVDAESNPVTVTDGKFTMPASNVTVSATFEVAKVFEGSELTLSGEYPTEFWKGETFSHAGMTVSALFNTGAEDVTSSAVFSGYDMTTAGTQTVTVTFTEGGVSQTATYEITVQTIANTQETAYTAAQAKALVDAGNDLSTPVYVKGIVSEIATAWNESYGNISFNVSADGTTDGDQFQFFRNFKGADKAKWTSTDMIPEVGDEVIGYGTMTYYAKTDIYEFAEGNYLVSLDRPVVLSSIELNTDDVKKTYKIGSDDVFSAENLVVTAHYNVSSNDKTIDLSDVTISGYNMEVANNYTVTVSYTENEVTKTATYQIQVKPNCETLATITKGAEANGTFDLSIKGEQCAETAISTVLTAVPAEHYHLASVTATNGTVGAIEGNTCTISDITADAEITAVFEEDAKGTATFVKGNEAATGTAPAAITKYVGEKLTIPANTFALLGGYKFAGWKYNETIYQKGDEFTVAGDAEFVAQWEALPVWASTYTSNIDLTKVTGTNVYNTEKVKVNGESTEYPAVKLGTSSKDGNCTVKVPVGATALHFHAVTWSGSSATATLSIKNGTTELFGNVIRPNTGLTGSSPYTLAGDATQDYYCINFAEALTEETSLVFDASVNRFAIYGVNVEKVNVELLSIEVSGTATTTAYYGGDEFDPAGLVVIGTYNIGEPQEITEGIEWSFDPATLAVGTTSVSVVATVGEKSSEAFVVNGLTVTKAPMIANWVANAQGYANGDRIEGSAIKHETTTVATVTFDQAEGTTPPAYYTTGTAARAYGGNTFTVAALKGFTINKIVLSFATGDGTNEITTAVGAYTEGTWTGEASAVTFTVGGTSGHRRIASISIYYEGELATPTGIVLNTETVKKEFAFGEEFNSDNLVVKAVYSDESEEDVTLAAEVVAPDMESAGEKTVRVNYLTFSETYTITVAAPTPVLTVDKTALAFGTVKLNATVEAKTVAVTLEHLAAATVALSGEGAAKFAIDVTSLTESGNVTVSATANEEGEFYATLTIAGEDVETKEVALSMTVVDVAKAENVDFSSVYSALTVNTDLGESSYEAASFTINYSKGTHNSNAPAYNPTDGAIRTYAGNTITINATKNIYMIEVVYKSDNAEKNMSDTIANNNHGYTICDGTSTTYTLNATVKGGRIEDIKVYYEDQKKEVRGGLVDGKFGTICVEQLTLAPAGAHFYTLNQYDAANNILTVNEHVGALEAGVPYIFEADGANIEGIVVANDETAKTNKGLYAVLDESGKTIETDDSGIYGIVGDEVRPAKAGAKFAKGRCYIQLDEVPTVGSSAPSRAFRVVRGTNVTTGFEALEAVEGAVKVIVNGELYILRDGKTYNVSGCVVK